MHVDLPDDLETTFLGTLVCARALPLFVDLDKTLLRTDLLWEAVINLIFQKPWFLLLLPVWLLKGKADFKQAVFERVTIKPTDLPYNASVLALIHEARAQERPVMLATASPRFVAEAIASHLGLFDGILGSTGTENLSGSKKLEAILARTSQQPFDYIGDSAADLPIFAEARQAILVNPSPQVKRIAEHRGNVAQTLQDQSPRAKVFFKAIRLHQWVKNLLLVIPLIVGHRIHDLRAVGGFAISFVAFGLMASSVYLINDLADLAGDRKHIRKRRRPLAAGTMSIPVGLALAILFAGGSIAMSARLLPSPFLPWLGIYLVTTLSYSFYFKRHLLVDVIVLAFLYTLRILAGGAAQHIPITEWLLGFSMFFFTSLAFAKRFTELQENKVGKQEAIHTGEGMKARDSGDAHPRGGPHQRLPPVCWYSPSTSTVRRCVLLLILIRAISGLFVPF